MCHIALLSLLISAAASAPITTNEDTTKVNFALAVDISAPTSIQTFICLKNAGYQTAFIRIYVKDGSGAVDPNGPSNLQNAYNAHMGLEIYIEPQPASTIPGSLQFDQAVDYLTNHGVNVRAVWLQVISPTSWPSGVQANINFIKTIIDRAQQRNIGLFIYTGPRDWQLITDGWTDVSSFVNLWYYHVSGLGESGATPANFNDFVPFGPWSQPLVKQYGQQIQNTLCSITTNTNAYILNSKAGKTEVGERKLVDGREAVPIAGNLMMTL